MTALSDDSPFEIGDALTVTAIVPVYNGATMLAHCLDPLLRMQRAGEIAEVIVVDDGSTDDSAACARSRGAQAIGSGGRLGPGGARNVGARAATGSVLWFVDADVVVHDDAARVLVDALRKTGASAVFGAYDDRPPAANFLSQYKNLVHRYYHVRHAGEAETFWAGCGAVTKRAFVDAGGFDAAAYPSPSIEDIELGARLRRRGHAIRLEPALAATHLKVWRLRRLLHTEIFSRALPWSRLIHSQAGAPDALNVSGGERLRAFLALLFVASLVLAAVHLVAPWIPFVILAALFAANWPLFAFFRQSRGFVFAIAALLFHQLYYLYSTAAYIWTWLGLRWPPSRERRTPLP